MCQDGVGIIAVRLTCSPCDQEETMETALYFPNIRVPEESWFTRVILYWDDAASIVPRRMHDSDVVLSGYMSELISAHLVRRIQPWDAQARNAFGTFDEDFIALLDSANIAEVPHSGRWT